MKFKTKLSLKQFQGIFFFILGGVLIYLIYTSQESYRTLLFIFSVLFVIHGITIFFEGTKQKYKIKHIFKKNNYDSKAEEEIAEYFRRKNIIFEHHPEIKIPKTLLKFLNIPFINIKLEPDFYLPEFDVFVEYWGLIEKEDYKKNSYDPKKKLYKDNGIEVIDLYPQNLKNDNLDWVFTTKILELFKQRQGINRNWR
jgi:hypothetical protein